MKGTKYIFLQPKQPLLCHHKFLVITFLTIFTFISFTTLLTTTTTHTSSPPTPKSSLTSPSPSSLPPEVFDALVNYAAASNSSGKMPEPDLRLVAEVLRRRSPCSLLVFGVGHETALWRALNHGGRTVFVDESEYYIAHVEARNPPGLEAYDVSYTTKVRELPELIKESQNRRRGDCRPVQNLLFSDCRLAINDLPNQLYDVDWDVILVDGPRGYSANAPGRMSAIFTAGVMARTTKSQGRKVDVFVHDFERNVEKVSSEEFLCAENLVGRTRNLGHFVIGGGGWTEDFCVQRKSLEGGKV